MYLNQKPFNSQAAMKSHLERIIIFTMAGYLLILLLLFVQEWYIETYPAPPKPPLKVERIQFPRHHKYAVKALQQYSQLPEHKKAVLKKLIDTCLVSVGQWCAHVRQSCFEIVCIGELHAEATRRFLSTTIFPHLDTDALLLEAAPLQLQQLIRRMKTGRDYFPLLDADIMSILRAAVDTNPDIRIYGIEQTQDQAEDSSGHTNPRDRSIADNFWAVFRPGSRHIILFGAFHCSNDQNWLFHNLLVQASPGLRSNMLNVCVLGEHQHGAIEAFLYFMDEIGLQKKDFAVLENRHLPAQITEWFPQLHHQILKKYTSLIVFRSNTGV